MVDAVYLGNLGSFEAQPRLAPAEVWARQMYFMKIPRLDLRAILKKERKNRPHSTLFSIERMEIPVPTISPCNP